MLALYESGEKEPLVREARFKLDYAEMQVEQQKKEIARLNRLAEKSMIPPAEMERQETALKLYEIKVETAKAALNTLETGYKKEQIDLEHAHIQALRDQIEVLEKRLAYSHIIAPITGRLVHSTASDTLAIVQDTARYVVVLPVKWRDRNLLKLHEKVTVRIEGLRARPVCEVSHISTDVWMMGGSHLVRLPRSSMTPSVNYRRDSEPVLDCLPAGRIVPVSHPVLRAMNMGRIENKYLVPPGNSRTSATPSCHLLTGRIQRPDDNEYRVHSIYNDTASFAFYHEKMAGIQHRTKVRVRGYNEGHDESKVFLEIKRKNDAVISKYRAPVLFRNVRALFETRDIRRLF